jgi:hypothetical protein
VQLILQRPPERLDLLLALLPPLGHLLGQLPVRLRLQVLEGQVLQLPAHLRHPQPVRERGVDLLCLERDPSLLLGAQMVERAHVVQTVGQLDQDDARILRHREQQLPVDLDLVIGRVAELHLSDLRHPVDDERDLLAELGADHVQRGAGVLDHVVDQPGGDRDGVQPEIRQERGHLGAVLDVLLPRGALLPLVGPLRELVGPRDDVHVEASAVGSDRLAEPRRQEPQHGCG